MSSYIDGILASIQQLMHFLPRQFTNASGYIIARCFNIVNISANQDESHHAMALV